MIGPLEDFLDSRLFHDPPEIHDGNAVGDVLDDAQIVADKQVGEILLVAQFHEQVDDLCLYGHIKCRDAFFTNEEFRLNGKRACNVDTLTLSAGKLMRITFLRSREQADDFVGVPAECVGRVNLDRQPAYVMTTENFSSFVRYVREVA